MVTAATWGGYSIAAHTPTSKSEVNLPEATQIELIAL